MVGRDNMRVKTKEAIHMLLMIIKGGGGGGGGGGESPSDLNSHYIIFISPIN